MWRPPTSSLEIGAHFVTLHRADSMVGPSVQPRAGTLSVSGLTVAACRSVTPARRSHDFDPAVLAEVMMVTSLHALFHEWIIAAYVARHCSEKSAKWATIASIDNIG